jgi:hypothetical protein
MSISTLGAFGCRDDVTAPSAVVPSAASDASHLQTHQKRTTTTQWNEIARALVAEHHTDPPMASRYYALLSVAQWQAVEDLPSRSEGSDVSRSRAVAVASAAILSWAYPDRSAFLAHQLAALGNANPGEAARVGERAAARVLERARSDGSDLSWTGVIPVGAGLWYSSAQPPQPPLRPRWGEVRPWLLARGDQLRPEPPPTFGSSTYLTALREVRQVSDTRTAEQLRIAEFWADGAATATPPGHWNAIAADLIESHHFDERRAAGAFALLNMALMDAGIACWDAKYHYWLIRPPQADPKITTPVGLPNFPSYVSGHAAFSGAAGEVLAAMFPDQASQMRAMAEQAAMSRLYAGIHYRFDNDVGLHIGRAIADLAALPIDVGQK